MVLINRHTPLVRLAAEQFDYARVGEDQAVLRLLAGVATGATVPASAHLMVQPCPADAVPLWAAAQACGVERRLITGGPAGSELLWSATFSLPLEVVEAPRTVFSLITGGAGAMALGLPGPVRRDVWDRPLDVSHRRPGPRRARSLGGTRGLAALATSVAMTAGTVPAVALAAAGGAGGAGGAGTSTTAPAPLTSTAVTTTTTDTTAAATDTTATVTTDTATTTGTTAATTTAAATTTTATTATTPAPPPPPSTPPQPTASAPQPASAAAHHHVTVRPAHGHHTVPGATAVHCTTSRSERPIAYAATATTAPGARLTCGARTSHPAAASHRGTPPEAATLTSGPGAAPRTHPAPAGHRPAHPHPQAGRPVHHPAAGAPRPSHAGTPRSSHTGTAAPTRPAAPPASSSPPAGSPTASPLSAGAPAFGVPRSWTGSVAANPALTGSVTVLSGLLSDGTRPPSFLLPIYMEAGRRYDVPWQVLAAINSVETNYGQNLNTSSAGAVGWMQFEPGTWKEWGLAVDGHSVPNPYDPRDAIFSAARYLAAAGAAHDLPGAVFAYNHAGWYVQEVLTRAKAIATHAQYERATVAHGTLSVAFATGQRSRPVVRYRGGVLSHFDRLIAAANMVSAANFPYVYGGGHEQPARFGPFDCSGSVSYVMQQAGYSVPTTVSGDIPSWGFPAGPGQVTIFYNPIHTFMRIGDRYFGTSGFARPGGGAGWFDVNALPASYLATFRVVHVPNLGTDSYSSSATPLPPLPAYHPEHTKRPKRLKLWPLLSTIGSFPSAPAGQA